MKRIFILFFLHLTAVFALPCTTFVLHSGDQLVFGRNYDWVSGAGMICTNQAGIYKVSMPAGEGKTASWISRYGSISFNQYGKEFPMGGMNEKGLVVELMWLDGTRYPDPDKRAALGVLQWIQYQLDNSATVKELLATDDSLRISSGTPLHYLVADAAGDIATIEFIDGKLVAHRGAGLTYPVLTNDRYDESVSFARKSKPGGNQQGAYGSNSLERFSKACSMVAGYEGPAVAESMVAYSFDILQNVSQGGHTKWSIVYDIANRQIHFKTHEFTAVKRISFSKFDFSCSAASKSLDMNRPMEGDISSLLEPFSARLNRQVVSQAVRESQQYVGISESEKEATLTYPEGLKCR